MAAVGKRPWAWSSKVICGSLLLVLAACASTYEPWINQSAAPVAAPAASYVAAPGATANDADLYVVVAFSGGGTRAAALAYGVLKALRATRFEWHGRATTLLDQVDVLSGVSGGSITAAYYAAYPERTFTQFRKAFLLRDFESDLLSGTVDPGTSYRLTSPRFGRGNLLAEKLDALLFHGVTYGQLGARTSGPVLLLTATDLSLGTGFEFTPDQFRLMCSDINAVPLAVAVAASSSVPVVFSPITLRNYAAACDGRLPEGPAIDAPDPYQRRVREYLAEQRSYRDAALRPYIHLVDGGLADNLGLRRIAQDIEMAGGLGRALERGGAAGVKKIVFLSVNAEHTNTFAADRSGDVPSLVGMFNAIQFGLLSHTSAETYILFAQTVARWRDEIRDDLAAHRGPFGSDAEIYDIEISLRSHPDPAVRKVLLSVPTTFALTPAQADAIVAAAPKILAANAEFGRLLRGLGACERAPSGAQAASAPPHEGPCPAP
jgi:NTE family protein